MAAAADALSGSRLLIAAALPGVLSAVGARGSWLPLGLVAVAALTDFLDGVAARRSAGGPSRHGAVLDNVADLGLVVGCTGAGAVLGLVPAAVPIAIAAAFACYVLASATRTVHEGAWRLARTRLGHAAGVLNYGIAGLVAAAVAAPAPLWQPALDVASLIVVAVNLAAILDRLPAWRGRPR